MKICKICKQSLSLDQYSPGQAKCKDCRRQYRKDHNQNNSDSEKRKIQKAKLKEERSKSIPDGHTMCNTCFRYFVTDGYANCSLCYRRRTSTGPKYKDITNLRIGMLVATSYFDQSPKGARWVWTCDCGGQRISTKANVNKNENPNCGCLKREYLSNLEKRRDDPTYLIWGGMKQRCFNKNNKRYHRYGGRGITVCDRWLIYENFLEDMGERPEGCSLDRIDNDGNYEPNNCQWLSKNEHNKKTANTQPRDEIGQKFVKWSDSDSDFSAA